MLFDPVVILYIYMAISVAMIFFNIIALGGRRGNQAIVNRHTGQLRKQMRAANKAMSAAKQPLPEAHLSYLEHKLRRVNWLTAFNQAVEPLLREPVYEKYFSQISGVFSALIPTYQGKNNIIKAYFSFTLSQFNGEQYRDNDFLSNYLLDCVIGDSIYLRENSLAALYRYGSEQMVYMALEKMNRNEIVHHSKLISDGLLTFTGDHARLAKLLMDNFDTFSTQYQVAIINYLGFVDPGFTDEMFRIITDSTRDKEVVIAALRYFRKNRYDPAVDVLLDYLQRETVNDWEYASVAASVLGAYPTARVKQALRQAMVSRQWHVRQNAIRSLLQMNLTEDERTELWQVQDRYAQEMLAYVSHELNAARRR